VNQPHRMIRCGIVKVPAGGMAPLGQVDLAVAHGAYPATGGRDSRLPPDCGLDVDDGGHGLRAAVDGKQTGGVGQHMAVGVDEAGQERPPPAVDRLRVRAPGLAPDLALRANGHDALALHGQGLGVRLPRLHGDNARVVQDEGSRHVHSLAQMPYDVSGVGQGKMPILTAELVVDFRKHGSLSEAERALHLAFRRLKRRARRYFGRFEYLTLLEISQRGWPRLLLLARGAVVPRRWLSENWRECGGSRVVNVRPVLCLKDFLRILRLPDFRYYDRRSKSESRRKARYSKDFFDPLTLRSDLALCDDDIDFWRGIWEDSRWATTTLYGLYQWIDKLLEALGARETVQEMRRRMYGHE
jgi:hypothetical protein